MGSDPAIPPDQAARDKIVEDLDRSLLVEAAAGTGKTTSLVNRMVALLAGGSCRVNTLAAVTFTRKAASEIRARFQQALESAAQKADRDVCGRLDHALHHQHRCFIGTIHSFCARLLRERPIEAGIDADFREIDEATDLELRMRAARQYADTLLAVDDPVIEELEQVGLRLSRSPTSNVRVVSELEELGLELPQLGAAFLDMAEFPEVEQWPAEPRPLPNLQSVRQLLGAYLEHLDDIGADQMTPGNCKLIPRVVRLRLASRHVDWSSDAGLMELLEHFDGGDPKIVQRQWTEGKPQALQERAAWIAFRDSHALPLLKCWREHRYAAVIRALRPAMAVYEQLRQDAHLLNFQDLLLKARGLLRRPEIRRYFRKRITHLLVDEFQDTDPLQAELMLLLTADDSAENDWRKCRPVGGSLFVVGDPKQSIYRFRRADMEIYSTVHGIFRDCGEVLELSANFRSSRPLVDWINGAFQRVFPAEGTLHQAARRDLDYGGAATLDDWPVERPEIDETSKPRLAAVDEARWIAGRIVELMKRHPELGPADFLVLTRKRTRLSIYAEALQAAGLPHQVTGGNELNGSPELQLLEEALLAATRPDDSIALLAALRGELFGISDRVLYAWKQAGGRVQLWNEPSESLTGPPHDALRDALRRLRQYARWLGALPLAVAIERTAEDLGLAARAAAASAARAGALGKAIELLRAGAMDGSASDLLDRLGALTSGSERRDGVPAVATSAPPVRVMNLHQAKGLEAKVVFLADPSDTGRPHVLRRHIDRLGEAPRGFLAVFSQLRSRSTTFRNYTPKLLACPPDWDQYEEHEQQHLRAEEQRLMYVAATRAGAKLIVCPCAVYSNPWEFFAAHVPEEPAAPPAPLPATSDSAPAPPSSPVREIAGRWEQARQIGVRVEPLKPLALAQSTGPPRGSGDGMRWGAAVHTVLEAMMNAPDADPLGVARAALEQQEIDAGRAPELVETLRRVERSSIWQRALASPQRYCEAPLTTLLPPSLAHLAPGPTLVRGVIDLAFREPQGWVVVDYKSDELPPIELEAAGAYYDGQLQAYAAAWEHLSGEKVVERGLLFTHQARYLRR